MGKWMVVPNFMANLPIFLKTFHSKPRYSRSKESQVTTYTIRVILWKTQTKKFHAIHLIVFEIFHLTDLQMNTAMPVVCPYTKVPSGFRKGLFRRNYVYKNDFQRLRTSLELNELGANWQERWTFTGFLLNKKNTIMRIIFFLLSNDFTQKNCVFQRRWPFYLLTGGTLLWCHNGLSKKVMQVCKCMIMRFTLSCKLVSLRNVSELHYNSCWLVSTTLSNKTKHPGSASSFAPNCFVPFE